MIGKVMTLSDSDLDCPVELFLASAKKTLGIVVVDYGTYKGRVEVTLQHPRTVPFKRLTTDQQKDLYTSCFQRIRDHYPTSIKFSVFTFEHCKDGNIHLHAYIDFTFTHPINVCGLLCEIADLWLRMLPKRFAHPLNGNTLDNYLPNFRRICIPQICLQFRYLDETVRNAAWEKYIIKCVQNPK